MRDILITLLVVGALPFILWRPYIGVLVWSWLGYMNPHRHAWGFAYDMPFAMMVVATLMVAMVFSRERYRLPWSGTMVIWMLYLGWMTLSTLLALYPERAWELYTTVIKIQLMTLVTLMIMTDRRRILMLIWVIVASIGFYSVKGGLFTLLTGGAHRVYGPMESNIFENNAMAVATMIIIPLMVYLYRVHQDKAWIRRGLALAILLSTVSVFGSHSRGALLTMAAVGGFFWLKSRSKLISGGALVILATLTFSFMPESWHERMGTISTYEEDESAMSRIHAWIYSINIANDRLTGGGINSWSGETYAIYSPESKTTNIVAHSIYFSVLADHGWPGLILFCLILLLTWRRLSRLIKYQKNSGDDPFRPVLLARMLQVSFVAYFSGGAFLSLAYFDLPWHLIAIAILVANLYPKPVPVAAPVARAPAGKLDACHVP